MEIFLVRHTSVAVPKGICYGKSDVALGETASEEITHTVQRLSKHCDFKKAQIWSSPAQRCVQLTEKITKDFQKEERLWEMNFGE
jgi:alpha-ribazole phosphatase